MYFSNSNLNLYPPSSSNRCEMRSIIGARSDQGVVDDLVPGLCRTRQCRHPLRVLQFLPGEPSVAAVIVELKRFQFEFNHYQPK